MQILSNCFFKTKIFVALFVFILASSTTFAQNADDALRLYEHNTIGWYQTTATARLTDKWGVVGEYCWRRTDFGKNWQQGLLRMGVNYELSDAIQARVGYSFIETYPFGDYPTLPEGYTNLEHRAYQQIEFKNSTNYLALASRFRLEQRWQNKHKGSEAVDYWKYSNRARFQVRADVPIGIKKLAPKHFYVAVFDEAFISFGPAVGVNLFDQNRLGTLVGYQFSKQLKVEGGYFNHIQQQGASVLGKSVIQLNEGVMVNCILNFDLRKPAVVK
jgi:Protein of unknown function (DUF2490)